MTVWNFGSINIDYVYRLTHLPAPGETLAALGLTTGLGGKGANQSVAVARAGLTPRHIGAVGAEGGWVKTRLADLGVDVSRVAETEGPSGHAIINVDDAGENSIVIVPGANQALAEPDVTKALAGAKAGDILLLQNETNHQADAARIGKAAGMRVVYSAAPFSAEAVKAVLGLASILVMNKGESEALTRELGLKLTDLPVEGVLVTLGGDGAAYYDLTTGHMHAVPAFPVAAVDTTGAGDTFTGYFAAGLDQGLPIDQSMRLAAGAAALQVTRAGAADAIPDRAEVEAFIARNS